MHRWKIIWQSGPAKNKPPPCPTLPALTESQEQQAGILKAEGVKAGVPDLHLPVARGGYHSLYVEMKSQTGTPSEAQKEWIAALLAEGNLAGMRRGCAAAVDVLEKYLKGNVKDD